jgi:hypothetical protein
MSMTDIVRDFKKMYYTTDDNRLLLTEANKIILMAYPSPSPIVASSGVGGWGRKRLTKKKNSQVSKKRKTRKHSQS